jgi:hypothetical protein
MPLHVSNSRPTLICALNSRSHEKRTKRADRVFPCVVKHSRIEGRVNAQDIFSFETIKDVVVNELPIKTFGSEMRVEIRRSQWRPYCKLFSEDSRETRIE